MEQQSKNTNSKVRPERRIGENHCLRMEEQSKTIAPKTKKAAAKIARKKRVMPKRLLRNLKRAKALRNWIKATSVVTRGGIWAEMFGDDVIRDLRCQMHAESPYYGRLWDEHLDTAGELYDLEKEAVMLSTGIKDFPWPLIWELYTVNFFLEDLEHGHPYPQRHQDQHRLQQLERLDEGDAATNDTQNNEALYELSLIHI